MATATPPKLVRRKNSPGSAVKSSLAVKVAALNPIWVTVTALVPVFGLLTSAR
ncbi:hypothetical protein [Lysobacter gummosus]|uniref:hypothetical protein n=1 Tax=Lysobacter gummosus TaxID=262324 RepID=UPI00363969E1